MGIINPTWESDCGTVKLWLGDCLEIMQSWPNGAVDAVVTDPPYGINTKSAGAGKLNPWADMCNSAFWYAAWMNEVRRIAKCAWSFLNWRSMVTFQKAACDIQWPIESLCVWDKCWIGPGGTMGLRPSYELIAFWQNGRGIQDRGIPDVQRFPWSSHKLYHPAEKPVDAMRFCIDSCKAEAVADPFMGSGTAGVAAVSLDCQFWGIELDPKHFETAKRRIQDELRKIEFLEPQRVKEQRKQAVLFCSDEVTA